MRFKDQLDWQPSGNAYSKSKRHEYRCLELFESLRKTLAPCCMSGVQIMALINSMAGVEIIRFTMFQDERGSFERLFDLSHPSCATDAFRIEEVSISHNLSKGVIRGLHYLVPEVLETKVISCVAGEVFDVLVDVREDSPTYLDHMAMHLNAKVPMTVIVPPGCAHGYMTLTDHSSLVYLMSAPYAREAERGLRFDDPLVGIEWPSEPSCISDKDRAWTLIQP